MIIACGRDLRHVGLLLNDSHASMRDDFEIIVPSVDNVAGSNGGCV